jgi:hypothetical protein
MELVASIASLIDAIACLIFQVVLTTPGTGARLWIMLLIDPIACILGYWVICQRLRETRPKLAELGFYLLISGTLFVVCQCVVEESASLNLIKLDASTASGFDILLELVVAFTVPSGLAIYAWLIATSPASSSLARLYAGRANRSRLNRSRLFYPSGAE